MLMNNKTEALIEAREQREFNVFNELMKPWGIQSNKTPQFSFYDSISYLPDGRQFMTELKEFSGNWPNHIIKKEKVNRLFRSVPQDSGLLYIVLNPDTKLAYCYDCRLIDWSKTKCLPLLQWVCETDHSLGKKLYDTYFIDRRIAHTFELSPEQINYLISNKDTLNY